MSTLDLHHIVEKYFISLPEICYIFLLISSLYFLSFYKTTHIELIILQIEEEGGTIALWVIFTFFHL